MITQKAAGGKLSLFPDCLKGGLALRLAPGFYGLLAVKSVEVLLEDAEVLFEAVRVELLLELGELSVGHAVHDPLRAGRVGVALDFRLELGQTSGVKTNLRISRLCVSTCLWFYICTMCCALSDTYTTTPQFICQALIFTFAQIILSFCKVSSHKAQHAPCILNFSVFHSHIFIFTFDTFPFLHYNCRRYKTERKYSQH